MSNYKVILTGKLLEGFDRGEGIEKLAKLFGISVEEALDIANTPNNIIRKDIDKEKADKYKQAIEALGFEIKVEGESSDALSGLSLASEEDYNQQIEEKPKKEEPKPVFDQTLNNLNLVPTDEEVQTEQQINQAQTNQTQTNQTQTNQTQTNQTEQIIKKTKPKTTNHTTTTENLSLEPKERKATKISFNFKILVMVFVLFIIISISAWYFLGNHLIKETNIIGQGEHQCKNITTSKPIEINQLQFHYNPFSGKYFLAGCITNKTSQTISAIKDNTANYTVDFFVGKEARLSRSSLYFSNVAVNQTKPFKLTQIDFDKIQVEAGLKIQTLQAANGSTYSINRMLITKDSTPTTDIQKYLHCIRAPVGNTALSITQLKIQKDFTGNSYLMACLSNHTNTAITPVYLTARFKDMHFTSTEIESITILKEQVGAIRIFDKNLIENINNIIESSILWEAEGNQDRQEQKVVLNFN